jgi:hypothetical protein
MNNDLSFISSQISDVGLKMVFYIDFSYKLIRIKTSETQMYKHVHIYVC